MTPNELIVDSFAGGGGASLGIQWALGRSPDIAINHDKEAIALHAANHPDSLHLAEDVWKVDPITACAGRPVGLMWLSPDCKHFSKANERSVEQPFQTITAKADSAIVTPYLVRTAHGDQDASGKKRGKGEHALDIEQPLGTVVGGGVKHALVAAFMAQHNTGNAGHQMEFPVSTIIGKGCTQGLVAAHIAKQYGDRIGSSVEEPLHTVVANGVHHALVASHIKRDFGTSTGAAVDTPLPTITSDGGGHASLVASFLLSYFEHQQTGNLFEPVPTVLSKDRFALVTVNSVEYVIVDIGMRMLVPRELYRAQGFPDSYKIEIEYNGKPLTKTAQVRMVGNSVSPEQARAIIAALFDRADSTPEELAA